MKAVLASSSSEDSVEIFDMLLALSSAVLLPLPASPPSRLVANNRAAVRMQGTLLGGGSMDDLSAQELAAFAGASKDPLQQPRPEYDLGVPTGRPDEVVWGARAPESAGEMAAWAARLQEKGIARLLCLLSDDEMAARASDGTADGYVADLAAAGFDAAKVSRTQLSAPGASAAVLAACEAAKASKEQLCVHCVDGQSDTPIALAHWMLADYLGGENYMEACDMLRGRKRKTGVPWFAPLVGEEADAGSERGAEELEQLVVDGCISKRADTAAAAASVLLGGGLGGTQPPPAEPPKLIL